jgi:uncharacterized protein (TIGR00255 family)
MINSMTGFAARNAEMPGFSWGWELRGVNAKGLDIRLRLPDWIEGLETGVRAQIAKPIGRGSIHLSLRVIGALTKIEGKATDNNLTLTPSTAVDILNQRGVIDSAPAQTDTAPLLAALLADLPALLDDFMAMRAGEGKALDGIIKGQLGLIKNQTAKAVIAADARKDDVAKTLRKKTLRKNLALVLDNSEGADAGRVAQELAMLAVKSDVIEEMDRLGAHVDAAFDLLAKTGPVGRKLDFLMQEFMREANTLCSKAQATDLTRIGLEMKATIDQMREQVQNVE